MARKFHDDTQRGGCLPPGATHAEQVRDAQGSADRSPARDPSDTSAAPVLGAQARADNSATAGCRGCGSDRTAHVLARCSDLCGVQVAGRRHHGHLPRDLGIGGGGDVQFTYCLDCGRIQGTFPLARTALEGGRPNDLFT